MLLSKQQFGAGTQEKSWARDHRKSSGRRTSHSNTLSDYKLRAQYSPLQASERYARFLFAAQQQYDLSRVGCCKTWTLNWTGPGDLETRSPESTFFLFLYVTVYSFISKARHTLHMFQKLCFKNTMPLYYEKLVSETNIKEKFLKHM